MDINIFKIIYSKPFLGAIIAQSTSQIFKVFQPIFYGKKPEFNRIADYGGIPSAHTAFIIGLTTGIGLKEGWSSSLFAMAVVFSSTLIYDIIKLRKTVEITLNMSLELMKHNNLKIPDNIPQFKAHTSLEIIVGGIWGIICALIIFFI